MSQNKEIPRLAVSNTLTIFDCMFIATMHETKS